MTRSSSTTAIVRPRAPAAVQDPAKQKAASHRSASVVGGLASQIKSAVAGVVEIVPPQHTAPARRPASRAAAAGRRRPVPKVITDGAVQLRSSQVPAAPGVEGAAKEEGPDSHRSPETPSTCCSSTPGSASGSVKGGYPGPLGFAASQPQPSPLTALNLARASAMCSVQMTEGDGSSAEIRTKVFRMGAPLLRSTIPLSMNPIRPTSACEGKAGPQKDASKRSAGNGDCDDVESVLSSSEVGVDDIGALSVTLDFPC